MTRRRLREWSGRLERGEKGARVMGGGWSRGGGGVGGGRGGWGGSGRGARGERKVPEEAKVRGYTADERGVCSLGEVAIVNSWLRSELSCFSTAFGRRIGQ